ncbi:CRISPR-associated endonuclease Cas1 [Actinobacillus genomosp. 1]|uniref:CRISPR-associated endonuclease Cas1 n=1 Tax=Actinobacillus genomosp. 1 TaxID=254839 RepID=UPI002441DA8D|nr:CRISPR-associated endonuclease Cas1 [Actinobacillus genomosp. 1]WGE91149.1 CRISPR-associated endonuclease Cas1 [Actinobacillus genomosp. 1]
MATLYIDRRCTELKLDGEVLIGYEQGERIATIPLAPLDRLYIKGDISLQASLLAKLGEKKIGVIFLQGRKNIPMLFMPQPHNDAERRIKQFRLSQDPAFSLQVAKYIVSLKLLSQKAILVRFAKIYTDVKTLLSEFEQIMAQIVEQHSISALRGIEGKAATIYFSALALLLPRDLNFNGRNRRPPRDPFNAMLSLGYTLLHSEAVLALYGVGLEPYVGFYHSLDYGRESLACDVMEVLRPQFDEWLLDAFQQAVFSAQDFTIHNIEGCHINKEQRILFYSEFEKVAEKFRKSLNAQCSELVKMIREYELGYKPQQRKDIQVEISPIESQHFEDNYFRQVLS